jgi:hypothetical protein
MMNANIISSGTPLEDVLPWTSTTTTSRTSRETANAEETPEQTILVNDSSIECDGRFLLYLTAAAALNRDNGNTDDNRRSTSSSRINSSSSSGSNRNSSSTAVGASSSSGEQQGITRILWLANGGWTTQLVAQALKKMSCPSSAIQQTVGGNSNISSSSSSNNTSTATKKKKLIQIRSLTQEIGQVVHELQPNHAFCAQDYVQRLYQEIKAWWKSQAAQLLSLDSTTTSTSSSNDDSPMLNPRCTCWLILDDVSALSALVGSRLTYALVMQLQALSVKSSSQLLSSSMMLPFSIMIRCSLGDPPQAPMMNSTCWVGAGGSKSGGGSGGGGGNDDDDFICWEQGLVEIADQVVDVIPMASGYSSNVHGRLVVTKSPRHAIFGNAANTSLSPPLVMNYCLTDSKVLAFRIVQSA